MAPIEVVGLTGLQVTGAEMAVCTQHEAWPDGMSLDAFAAALEASPTPMIVTDARRSDNPIIWANAAFLTLTGYAREEVYGRNCRLLQGPDTAPDAVRRMREALADARPIECELFNYRKDGSRFRNGMTINPVRDASGELLYFFSAQADMTEKHRLEEALKRANDDLERQIDQRTAALQNALEQKTALLHEVDHRVKNNLQVITSLMLLKSRRTPLGEARDALQSMAERIGALSTAHRMLYSADQGAQFDIRDFTDDFLGEVAAGLADTRVALASRIEAVTVPAAMAAPLALMMHELATNAVRHAFPEDRAGRVCVSATRQADSLCFVIEDDGVGLAGGVVSPGGFGCSLVDMVVRQMRGRVVYAAAAPGTRVEVTIPLNGAGENV